MLSWILCFYRYHCALLLSLLFLCCLAECFFSVLHADHHAICNNALDDDGVCSTGVIRCPVLSAWQ